eukprot:9487259-Pyramimonas_sp.AAC.1
MTLEFSAQHGDLSELLERVGRFPALVRVTGAVGSAPPAPPPQIQRQGAYDFSQVTMQPHPGNPANVRTLVYVELKGGLDSSAAFVNIKTPEEVIAAPPRSHRFAPRSRSV